MSKKNSLTKKEKIKKSLKNSVKEGAFYSVNAGMGEHYLNPFAIILNATPAQIGFLMSFPQFLGSLAQFLSIKLLDKFKNRKKLIAAPIILQALTRFPLLLIPFFVPEQYKILTLTISICLYFLFGSRST